MTPEGKARHALFKGFEETINSNSYLDDPDILGRKCPAIPESGHNKGKVCGTDLKMESSATQLYQTLSATTIITDEKKLLSDFGTFIKASHCGNHGKARRISDGLEKWRKDQLARYLLSLNVKSEVPVGYTPSQDSLTDCSYDAEADCTPSSEAAFCGGVVNGEGESLDARATTLEFNTPMRKVPSTNITIHEVSIPSEIEPKSEVSATVLSVQESEDSSTETAQMISTLTLNEEASLPGLIREPEKTSKNEEYIMRRKKEDVEELKNIGIASLKRRVSRRDNSGVIREFHKPFTADDDKEGILYVLAKTKAPGIFKIGWSTLSAKERLEHPKNCYANEAEIIYESPTAFHGAYRAEKCAHAILKNEQVQMVQCFHCDKKHREYFKASKTDVLRTVKVVEKVLRLPGYVYSDREQRWKLSDLAYEVVHGTFRNDLDRMETALEPEVTATVAVAKNTLESGEQAIPARATRPTWMETAGRTVGTASGRVARVFRRSLTAESNEEDPSNSPKTRSISSVFAKLKDRSDAAVKAYRADFEAAYAQASSPRK